MTDFTFEPAVLENEQSYRAKYVLKFLRLRSQTVILVAVVYLVGSHILTCWNVLTKVVTYEQFRN